MLSVTVAKYIPSCEPNSGGISRAWVFDPADFDFTKPGATSEYTAVALAGSATILGGSGFFPIKFNYLEGQLKSPQTMKGTSVKYAHSLSLQVPEMGKELTDFLIKMQKASSCGSLAFIVEQNNGRVMVLGESIVNADVIPNFRVVMDGTELDGGKAFDDANGATLMFKGDYTRPLCEFTGGVAAIIALEAA
jgi:hypothetical protein